MIAVPILVLVACGEDEGAAGDGPTRTLGTAKQSGVATFYDADGSGNCSFDKTPDDLDVVALSKPEYNLSALCGACLRVTGPKGDVLVRVVDSCPPCAQSKVNLDLSEPAFAKIADKDDGRISISYQLVSCKITGNIAYHFKDGSSKFWTAIQVRNHRVPIAKLEYAASSKTGAWVELERADYNYFITTSGVGEQPKGLKVRVTATDGQVIEDTLAGAGNTIPSDTTLTGTKQFD